jgi:hypothetical protein
MGGTNGARAKRALIDGARDVLAAEPTTAEVHVTYAYRGHEDFRELVHADRVVGRQSYPTSAGGAARFARDESNTVTLYVIVHIPGGDQEQAEGRACEIGTVLEEWIAATAELPGFEPGEITSVGIDEFELDSDVDDDGATALLSYDIRVDTRLT